ncbi:alpha-defensin 24-like [Meriones unguiculatus]|uniref:Cryptdin n=1 Tax=Meriones unguiculatus TaxID=10047 RepID=Q1ET74_MERUN|nr:alpha-defensin 24-like [Meriones unguiculatus]XP_060237248.1 alpha-defensin 24-like [Meriones unguiculatus]BAE95830.1 cryptdin [Meriones unguiculatus]
MKTLVLLSAVVLLAFLAQADPLPEPTEETKTEEQPGVEDQDVTISFGGPAGLSLQDAASRALWTTCHCRPRACKFLERISGICTRGGKSYVFCCR